MAKLALCLCMLYAFICEKGETAIYRISEGDSELIYDGSRYTVVYYDRLKWIEAKQFCTSYGEHLVSLTTVKEVTGVVNFMQTNYPDTSFVIGLSREAGLNKSVDSNWMWETGEQLDSSILNWEPGQPDSDDAIAAGVKLSTDGYLKDRDVPSKNMLSKFFICETELSRLISRFFVVGDKTRLNTPVYLRCAIRCQREYGCNGFYVDDAECHIEMENVNKQHSVKGGI